METLTWNLFHGRAVPGAGRSLLPEFSEALAGWAWDVALLQECPPWWPAPLAAACGAEHRLALSSRNWLLPVRRFLAERWPDLMKSQGGGSNAILVRGEGIAAHRDLILRRTPERRVAHGVRLAASGAWVVNLHATAHVPARAQEDLDKARGAALAWAGDAPVVLGGDLNLRKPSVSGFEHVAARDVDHLFVRGLKTQGCAEVLSHGSLSDHPPLVLSLAVP